MQLKLKENPREWMKFTAVMASAASLILLLLVYRRLLRLEMAAVAWMAFGTAVLICLIRPRWFRSFYRVGMTASFHVGRVMGALLLSVFFLVVLTPIGIVLRLSGKDLLALKRPPTESYWIKSKPPGPMNRQF